MIDAYTSQVLTFIGINSILALSLYITALAGQLSVGHAAFMGIGAYTSALLMTRLGWPFFLTAPCGALVGGSSGFCIGLPTLRLKDLYLAIATLAFNIIWVVMRHEYRGFWRGPGNLQCAQGDQQLDRLYFPGSPPPLLLPPEGFPDGAGFPGRSRRMKPRPGPWA